MSCCQYQLWWSQAEIPALTSEDKHEFRLVSIGRYNHILHGKQNVAVIVHTVLLEVLYVIENDAESSASMQVEFPSVTFRVTA